MNANYPPCVSGTDKLPTEMVEQFQAFLVLSSHQFHQAIVEMASGIWTMTATFSLLFPEKLVRKGTPSFIIVTSFARRCGPNQDMEII